MVESKIISTFALSKYINHMSKETTNIKIRDFLNNKSVLVFNKDHKLLKVVNLQNVAVCYEQSATDEYTIRGFGPVILFDSDHIRLIDFSQFYIEFNVKFNDIDSITICDENIELFEENFNRALMDTIEYFNERIGNVESLAKQKQFVNETLNKTSGSFDSLKSY